MQNQLPLPDNRDKQLPLLLKRGREGGQPAKPAKPVKPAGSSFLIFPFYSFSQLLRHSPLKVIGLLQKKSQLNWTKPKYQFTGLAGLAGFGNKGWKAQGAFY